MSSYNVTIPIGNRIPGDYLRDLHEGIAEVLKLVYERRDLDLGEQKTYALYMVQDLQQRLVKGKGVKS